MARFEKFLFFYSILAVTVLLISFGLFEPKPLNFISVILLVPACFYFWVRLTNPEAVSAEKWSFRFLFSLVLLSLLGTGTFYFSRQFANTESQNAQLKQAISTPSAEPTTTKTPQPSPAKDTQGESVTDLVFGTPIPLLEITGKPGITTIDVYQSPTQVSKRIAGLSGSVKYLYLVKQNNWYNIILSGSEAGWVSASQVQEVQ
jgi:hypothetical protein